MELDRNGFLDCSFWVLVSVFGLARVGFGLWNLDFYIGASSFCFGVWMGYGC